ncbi:MAG: RNA pyrophosphohydrolase [Pseudomonadales bacterium]
MDEDGYRPNVGIILANGAGQVLWARRAAQDGWQFPQGGIDDNETPTEALYRELAEEVGLTTSQVQLIASTDGWLKYTLPERMQRTAKPGFIGQKQKWFLLKMLAADDQVCLNQAPHPEFDRWRWVSYWYPLGKVIDFKQDVYRQALKELAPQLPRCLAG